MESRKAHRGHTLRVVTQDYKPRNVPLTETHDLIRCSCNFFGWLTKELDPEPYLNPTCPDHAECVQCMSAGGTR